MNFGGSAPVRKLVALGENKAAYAPTYGTTFLYNTMHDMPGCAVAIPANSGPLILSGFIPAIAINSSASWASTDFGYVRQFILDENNITLQQTLAQVRHTAASQQWMMPGWSLAVYVPNNSAPKTYRMAVSMDGWTASSKIASPTFWAGPGNVVYTNGSPTIYNMGAMSITAMSVSS